MEFERAYSSFVCELEGLGRTYCRYLLNRRMVSALKFCLRGCSSEFVVVVCYCCCN